VLSSDNFDTIKVATVAARPLAGLRMPVPEVDLLFGENDMDIDIKKTYVMLETRSSYFEAYRHTLRSLQRIQEAEYVYLCTILQSSMY
jgi:helicase required for RNAi-mediated heterochromatin assembly 1